jgi:hypothetical protein
MYTELDLKKNKTTNMNISRRLYGERNSGTHGGQKRARGQRISSRYIVCIYEKVIIKPI